MKNRYKHLSKKRCLKKTIFDAMLVDLGKEHGGKLAPNSMKNPSSAIAKNDVLKAGTMIFEIRIKKNSRKMDSILKMMHSDQLRIF